LKEEKEPVTGSDPLGDAGGVDQRAFDVSEGPAVADEMCFNTEP
jgi:hypothetical protein